MFKNQFKLILIAACAAPLIAQSDDPIRITERLAALQTIEDAGPDRNVAVL